jgi:TDG/mug DNA glycosylase family protein
VLIAKTPLSVDNLGYDDICARNDRLVLSSKSNGQTSCSGWPSFLPLEKTTSGAVVDQAFDLVANTHCHLLLLGSFPGVWSLRDRQYYANPRNQFWQLLSPVIGIDLVPLGYADRLATVLAHGIGLWDVVATARRVGSLDSALRDVAPRALHSAAAGLPDLRAMAFNGATAFKIGQRQMAKCPKVKCLLLPSSSPAHTIGLAAKAEQWRHLASYLAH